MSQHDYVIANGTGAAVRSDLNNALAAIVTQNSGATAPATTYAYQWWADTTTGLLKIRNAANNAWVTIGSLSTAGFGLLAAGDTLTAALGSASTPGITFTGDLNTGIYSPGADQVAISTNGTARVTVNSSGNVGIGTTSPSNKLHSVDTAAAQALFSGWGSGGGFTYNGQIRLGTVGSYQGIIDYDGSATILSFENTYTDPTNSAITWKVGGGEKARLTGAGRLLVGTSTARTDLMGAGAQLQVEGTTFATARLGVAMNANNAEGGNIYLVKSRGTSSGGVTVVSSGDVLGDIEFGGADGTNIDTAARIRCEVDGTPGANDMPGRIVLATTADGASSPTERARVTSGGYLKASNDGTYFSSTGNYHELGNTNDVPALILRTRNASQTDTTLSISPVRAANSAYKMLMCYSGNEADLEFNLRGDGNAYADGSWNGGGADYAEYFEWSDSNPDEEDRRGISVVLDGDKIREAIAGEDPIGVISGNPSVVGDAAWNKWNGKHLRDEFGSYILDDNGERQLNPSYDPSMEYVSREERPEWDCVGLMGKLRIRKGQVTGSRWIKMRDISDSVEEWLVR